MRSAFAAPLNSPPAIPKPTRSAVAGGERTAAQFKGIGECPFCIRALPLIRAAIPQADRHRCGRWREDRAN